LFKGGTPIKLPPQPFKVLLLLLEHSGEVVSREDIRRQIWGNSTFVDFERGINFSINQIRGALCDDPQKPRYIETFPRFGYRFVATVERDATSSPVGSLDDEQIPERKTASVESERFEPVQSVFGRRNGFAVPKVKGLFLWFAASAVIAILAAVAWWQPWRSPGLSHGDFTVTRITETGGVTGVTVSRDGEYVAYSAGPSDKESLYVRRLANGKDLEVSSAGPGFHGITFSPDGKNLYFVRADDKDTFFKYLYQVPVQGGPVRKLVSDVDSAVSFSPDGHEYAYEHCLVPGDKIEIKVARADGGNDRLLAEIPNSNCFMYQPGLDWSQDGQTIAVAGQLTGQQATWVMHTVSTSDGKVRRLYSSPKALGRPVWAADGSALLFSHPDENSSRRQLWRVAFPSGRARQLSHDLSNYGNDLAATTDGRVIVTTAGTINSNVWIAPASDLNKAIEIPLSGTPVFQVAEARDGKLLMVGLDGTPWLMIADGSQRIRFTGLRSASFPTPCGRYVAFLSNDTDTHALVRVNADGTHPITLASGSFWAPVCSGDETDIYYLTTNTPQKIWRVSLESGKPVEVAAIEEDTTDSFAVSPDGKLLAYTYSQFGRVPSDGWHVAIITLAGDTRKRVVEVNDVWGLHWSQDGRMLHYLSTENSATNIWALPLAGGKPTQITNFSSPDISSFSWSADGSRLFMVRGTTKNDVALIRELQ
jgi:Tol biopolymer transport system component/DNA-binding winged helix-turn-helix (wHTH) protein